MAIIGHVALVGAGPGNPGLITVRGRALLESAQVVIHDRLVPRALLDLTPPDCLRIDVGKSPGQAPFSQEQINTLLIEKARLGLRVVRLKGGDPNVFGRGAEEAEYLHAAGIPFEVVPGVTAALGVASYAGIPLTHRNNASAVAFVTGHHDPNDPANPTDWAALAAFPGTLVVYMGLRNLAAIASALIRHGKSPETPAALVVDATTPLQTTLCAPLKNLASIAEQTGISGPALIVIGEVVARREALAWFDRLPLKGARVLVTRPPDDQAAAARDLEALGAQVIAAPLMQIVPPDDPVCVDRAIAKIAQFDWIVATSRYGVRAFLQHLLKSSDLRALGQSRLAAIGPATAQAFRDFHLTPDVVSEVERSEGLVDALRPHVQGARVLALRGDRGREVLREGLADCCEWNELIVYQQRDVDDLSVHALNALEHGLVEWVTLTSPALAKHFHALLSDAARARIGRETRIATISPVTSAAVTDLGWTVAAEATTHTWAGLVAALSRAHGLARAGALP